MTHQGTMHQSNDNSEVSVSLPSQDVKQKEVETKAVNSATTANESSTHPWSRECGKPSPFKIQFTFGRPLQQDQGKAAILAAAARASFFSSFDRTDLDMKVQRDVVRNYNRKRLLERNSAVFAQTTSSIKNHEIFILAILEEAKYFHQRKFCSIAAAQSSSLKKNSNKEQQQQDEQHERQEEEEEDPSLFSPVIGIVASDGEEIRIPLPSSGIPISHKEEAEWSDRVDHEEEEVVQQQKKKKIDEVPYLRRLEAEYETVFKNLLTLRNFVRQTFINAANGVGVAAVADSSQQQPAHPAVMIDPYSQTFASITKFRLFQQIVL